MLTEYSSLYQFQFTPLREGRPHCLKCWRSRRYFNSRPSARGDVLRFVGSAGSEEFQFTPLREGRPKVRHHRRFKAAFQFTPLREGRLRTSTFTSKECAFQFTPLREGRPNAGFIDAEQDAISIHAPPRGATARLFHLRHRPDFNSRPSARGDGLTASLAWQKNISIHAPPRGATATGGDNLG